MSKTRLDHETICSHAIIPFRISDQKLQEERGEKRHNHESKIITNQIDGTSQHTSFVQLTESDVGKTKPGNNSRRFMAAVYCLYMRNIITCQYKVC